MINILIVSDFPQRFLAQLQFANEIKLHSPSINPVFFLSQKVQESYPDTILNMKFSFFTYDQKNKNNQNTFFINRMFQLLKNKLHFKIKKTLKKIHNFILTTPIYGPYLENYEKRILKKLHDEYEYYKSKIIFYNISVVLLNGDRHLEHEPAFLKVCIDLKIPSVIPFLVDFADEQRILRNGMKMKKSKRNFFISHYLRKSNYELKNFNNHSYDFYPVSVSMALKKFGVLTKNFLVMGSGHSDILCLNTRHNYNYYIRKGVEPEKIRLIGDVSFDKIYNSFSKKKIIKKKYQSKYNLKLNKKIIIIVLPQLGEHSLLPWDQHWREIEFLMQSVCDLKQNVLVSLHPKMNRKQYLYLENTFECHLVNESLVNVLPIADMFVASFSSTIIWSILCGIPSLVVDFYNFKYKMYDFLSTLTITSNKNDLAYSLRLVLNSRPDFSKDWVNLSRKHLFDGKTIERYCTLIKNVYAKH